MLDLPVMGVNAPKEHQATIAELIYGLMSLLRMGKTHLFAYPETMINETATSPTPDILLFDPNAGQNVAIIEVTITANEKKDFKKVKALVDDYELAEGFTYDYRKKSWRKYKSNVGEITENPSFCDSIGYDLNEFL
jgi:Uma2 family endonuclease